MPRHIGIAACSAEGAALCYRTICMEGAAHLGAHGHPEITMHTPSLAAYVACLERGDLQGVANLMLRSANKLAAAGADFVICPDNTIHAALGLVLPTSPLPWLHIAEVVADAAVARGFRRLGITGTRWLVDSEVYPAALAARGGRGGAAAGGGPRMDRPRDHEPAGARHRHAGRRGHVPARDRRPAG